MQDVQAQFIARLSAGAHPPLLVCMLLHSEHLLDDGTSVRDGVFSLVVTGRDRLAGGAKRNLFRPPQCPAIPHASAASPSKAGAAKRNGRGR